ncbi:MAG: hypothetical protein Q8K59_04150, partial [Nitrosomonas sp.]|nr:hypothetical protein [Nitrosomonas sp.]MDP1950281.1 hypothetical protein [Nitrosomonas sp.]
CSLKMKESIEMALAKEDIEEIQNLIAKAFSERPEVNQVNVRYELEIRKRIVRVEEELKHQRELMIEGFNRVDKRFEQMVLEMNTRFTQVDKRFEALTSRIDRLFMIWSFATTLTVGGLIVAAIKFLP